MNDRRSGAARAHEEMKRLHDGARALGTFWRRYHDRAAGCRVDKANAEFVFGRDHYRVLQVPVGEDGISFCAYTGEYGVSTCSAFPIGGNVDGELVKPYLKKALNKHAETIFATMAEMMEADAAKRTGSARQELKAMLRALDDIDGDNGGVRDGTADAEGERAAS